MTKHIYLPDGSLISISVYYYTSPPAIEPGWKRIVVGKHYCIDEWFYQQVKNKEDNLYEWVDERTSE